MSGAPGGRAGDVRLLLDDGESTAGGLGWAGRNPITGLMNCASHVVEHRVHRGPAREICEDIPHHSLSLYYIDNDNVDNDCFTVQMGFSPQQYYFAF